MLYQFQDRFHFFKSQWARFGVRSVVRAFRPHLWRSYSRNLIQSFLQVPGGKPFEGRGIEIGVGAQTIAPLHYTLLTDGFKEHATNRSLATEFFPAGQIPYPDETFSFVLSEHVLEHVPNALKVLREWRRVLKPHGKLFLFLPHPDRTFDQGRPLTSLAHLIEDEQHDSVEQEDAHYDEWMREVVNSGRASHYASLSKEECLMTNSLHRHVWNEKTMAEVLKHVGFKILHQEAQVKDRSDSFVIVAEK